MASSTDYSIAVDACVLDAQRSKFVWTLRLNGFKEGQYIYIYRITKGKLSRITTGHRVTEPTQPVVVDSWEASLFDVSKQGEYCFR